eukprot:2593112-Amphidinium_carterae.1
MDQWENMDQWSSGQSESGQSDAKTHDDRHLEDWAKPFDLEDPESHGLERLYPGPRPHRLRSWRNRLYPELFEPPEPIVVYKHEEGRYPFSCVQKLPDVDPNNRGSIEERRIAERKTVFEVIVDANWMTPTNPGFSMCDPDDYPWEEVEDELFDVTNRDPRKGPVARDVWYNFWTFQADLYCDQPAAPVTRRAGLYRCYVCKKQHWTIRGGVELRRCLICRN